MAFTLGIDFGTNSVRAVVVDCSNGREIGSRVIDYPSGKRGVLLDPRDPNLARQNPGDYFYGLQRSVQGALAAASTGGGFYPTGRTGGGGAITARRTPPP